MKEMPISKVIYEGRTLIDLTSDTVTAEDLSSGVTAHDAKGNLIVGTESETSSGMSLNVFTQENEPESKDGVWIQTNNRYENIVVGSKTYRNTPPGEWTQEDELPFTFSNGGSVVEYDNKIYAIQGGNNFYAFDGNNWRSLGTPPGNKSSGISFVYDEKLQNFTYYTIGTSSYYQFYTVYDGTNWVGTSPNPPYYMYNGGVVVYKNKVHLLGGYKGPKYHYVFDGIEWKYLGDLPHSFQGGRAVVWEDKIHILGGVYSTNINSDLSKKHYAFDGTNWEEVSTLPYSFQNGCAVVWEGKLHILGAYYTGISLSETKKHYAFDGTNWEEVSTLPYYTPEGAVVWEGKLHIIGSYMYTDYYKQHYVMAPPVKEQYTGKKVSIYQNSSNEECTYATQFLTDNKISGENNKFPSGFDDVFYIDESGNVEESPTYYGNGTQWIKFKN